MLRLAPAGRAQGRLFQGTRLADYLNLMRSIYRIEHLQVGGSPAREPGLAVTNRRIRVGRTGIEPIPAWADIRRAV